MDTKQAYNKIAGDYARDHQHDLWDTGLTNNFVKLLPPHAKVLDVGCGPGKETAFLVSQDFDVIGIDFSQSMVQEAKKRVPQGNFMVMDMRQLTFPADTFDGILAKACLLHIPKTEVPPVIAGFHKILKPHGLLYLTVKQGTGEQVVTENDYGYEYSRFFSFFTKAEMEQMLIQTGFTIKHFDTWKSSSGTPWLRFLVQKR